MMTSAGGNGGIWLHDNVETLRSKQLNERRAGGSPLFDDDVRASSCSRLKDSKAGGRGVFVVGVSFSLPRGRCPWRTCAAPALCGRKQGPQRARRNRTWNQRAESDARKKVPKGRSVQGRQGEARGTQVGKTKWLWYGENAPRVLALVMRTWNGMCLPP